MTVPTLCAHCQAPVRGRSPADPQPLCRRELSVAWSGPDCAVLVADWGHRTPCVDCTGLAGPEDDVPGLMWLAAKDGLAWDAPEMVEGSDVVSQKIAGAEGLGPTALAAVGITDPVQDMTRLRALAAAVDCDTAETVRWEIAETLDKCAGTKERLLEQIRAGEDCDTCPPGFLAVVMQAESLARALEIALDLLKVPALPADAEAAS